MHSKHDIVVCPWHKIADHPTRKTNQTQTPLIKHVPLSFHNVLTVLGGDKLCSNINEQSWSGPLLVWVRNIVIDWAAIIESLLLLVYKLAGGLNTDQLGNLASSWIQLKKSMFCPQ